MGMPSYCSPPRRFEYAAATLAQVSIYYWHPNFSRRVAPGPRKFYDWSQALRVAQTPSGPQ